MSSRDNAKANRLADMTSNALAFFAVFLAITFAALADAPAVDADPVASPAPVPIASQAASPPSTPTAAPSAAIPLHGFHIDARASTTFIDQDTAGPGQIGPEASGFVAGAPLAPNTPYDLFSSAPETPGIAGIGQVISSATYRFEGFQVGATAGLGYIRGSATNAAYWSENLLPSLNPHLGSQALPYRIAFPTRPGQDDATAFRLSLLAGSVATPDGKLRIRGGWFDLAQTDRFVFAQPALTSVNPQIAYAPAESLSSGVAGATFWQPDATALPLHGFDAVTRRSDATLELTNGALPSLPGESARISMGSFVLDRGEGTRFSTQLLHVTTAGTPFVTTVPTGLDPRFTSTPQGVLPTSLLSGQRETIAGLRAAVHVLPAQSLDGILEIGRAWYDASPVSRAGTERPGGFYHIGFQKNDRRVTASLDLYRMEPRYATIILPYGISENQWSAAFAWPGQWLKSNYQLVDNSVLGVNRQGYRVRYYVDKGPLEVHLEYTDLRQIEPETTVTSTQSGYVDGYYLPQIPSAATFGRQKRYGFWTAWHPAFGDVTLDIVDDTLYRPFVAAHPEDRVSYEVSQAVLTFSRALSGQVTAAAGIGRYAIKGAFAEPIDFAERLAFVGAQIAETPKSTLLLTFRRTSFGGLSTAPASSRSADFTGSSVIIEQRVRI